MVLIVCPRCGKPILDRYAKGSCHCSPVLRSIMDWFRGKAQELSWARRVRAERAAEEAAAKRTAKEREAPAVAKPQAAPAPVPQAGAPEWLHQARTYSGIHDWKRAIACATEAIRIAPAQVEAYMIRALALRVKGDLDAAIADYSQVVERDPQNGEAWMYRGACKAQKASSTPDRARKVELLGAAHPDYQKASGLMPDNEQAGLALLELEICAGKYREAVGTTGVWWGRIQGSHNKLICAWLGSMAFILAGRPASKWAHFREFLETDSTQLGPTDWSVAEIGGVLQDLARGACDAAKLAELNRIHRSFVKHFRDGGPMIV